METTRIMIVDDSSVMRKIVERSLRQAGFDVSQVFEANNGVEALELLNREQLDLILTDVNMPTMDGLEFVRRLRSEKKAEGVPIVMITTEASEARVREAISYGAQGYIRKPFTPEQVKEHVGPLLRK
jgi:two-component system, chemotaxis family, chemotaxis protein CheY